MIRSLIPRFIRKWPASRKLRTLRRQREAVVAQIRSAKQAHGKTRALYRRLVAITCEVIRIEKAIQS